MLKNYFKNPHSAPAFARRWFWANSFLLDFSLSQKESNSKDKFRFVFFEIERTKERYYYIFEMV